MHPITFTVHRVLQSGAQRLQGPSRPNPVEQRTPPAHKLSLHLRPCPAVLREGLTHLRSRRTTATAKAAWTPNKPETRLRLSLPPY
jgi:hypothetical protein